MQRVRLAAIWSWRIMARPKPSAVRQPRSSFFLRHQHLIAFAIDGINGIRRTGVQAQPARFEAAGCIELERWGGKPGAGRTYGNTDRLVRATIGMTHQVIADDHHGFDSFKKTLREDLEHVFRHTGTLQDG